VFRFREYSWWIFVHVFIYCSFGNVIPIITQCLWETAICIVEFHCTNSLQECKKSQSGNYVCQYMQTVRCGQSRLDNESRQSVIKACISTPSTCESSLIVIFMFALRHVAWTACLTEARKWKINYCFNILIYSFWKLYNRIEYCQVFMAAWLIIITGLGLDDWIH
jgi:hypothetical protein